MVCPVLQAIGPRCKKTMKKTLILLSIVFLAGCAAPPPVRIASSLLGRGVFQQVKDKVTGSDDAPAADQADQADQD